MRFSPKKKSRMMWCYFNGGKGGVNPISVGGKGADSTPSEFCLITQKGKRKTQWLLVLVLSFGKVLGQLDPPVGS